MSEFFHVFFDTEDNAAALSASGRSSFEKRLTEIVAVTERGEWFAERGGILAKEKFLKWLLSLGAKICCWSHNADYDLSNLFADSLDELDMTFVGGRFVRAQWMNVTFCDSFKFFPMRLEVLGSLIDIPKENLSSKTRCETDVKILACAMMRVINTAKTYGVDVGATMGSFAARVWKSFGQENWHSAHWLEREAYMGGRVEIFKTAGEGDIVTVDVNSLYPAILAGLMPSNPIYGRVPVINIDDYIASVKVYVPHNDMQLAPLPCRRWDGTVFYPFGTFWGVFTSDELKFAKKYFGVEVLEISDSILYSGQDVFYGDFVNSIYEKKQNAVDLLDRFIFKNILNSFSGQLGMNKEMERTVNIVGHELDDGIEFGSKKLIKIQVELPKRVNYCHAAFCNSRARIRLLEFMMKIRPENLIYCSTDSVIFHRTLNQELRNFGEGLGQWRIVSEDDFYEIHHEHIYRTGDNVRAKGIPRLHSADYFESGACEFEQPYTIREGITLYNCGNKKRAGVWHKVRKIAKSSYDKKVLNNGSFLPRKIHQKKYYSRYEA